jgi:ABC-2 type transport system ATP-binding protein
MAASISVSRISKRFGSLQAVDGVSFDVEDGEFFGLLGPNGAGKTTSIRMMTGVMKPDSGGVLIGGRELRRHPLEIKREMGVIPEVGTVYPDLSARENLELFGRFYGMDRAAREEAADRLLKEFGLEERADDYLRKFSKGMRQRVSIGCAMVHGPKVLFLDEPTEGLDVQSRRMITEKVRSLNRNGTTVMLTTHNIEEANRLCHRVCIINKGKVVAIDTPEHLRATCEEIQSVEVAFDRKAGCSILQGHGCVERVEESGDKLKVYTSDPDATVKLIMRAAEANGLKVISLNTIGPSLEDVFVRLTEGKR